MLSRADVGQRLFPQPSYALALLAFSFSLPPAGGKARTSWRFFLHCDWLIQSCFDKLCGPPWASTALHLCIYAPHFGFLRESCLFFPLSLSLQSDLCGRVLGRLCTIDLLRGRIWLFLIWGLLIEDNMDLPKKTKHPPRSRNAPTSTFVNVHQSGITIWTPVMWGTQERSFSWPSELNKLSFMGKFGILDIRPHFLVTQSVLDVSFFNESPCIFYTLLMLG